MILIACSSSEQVTKTKFWYRTAPKKKIFEFANSVDPDEVGVAIG